MASEKTLKILKEMKEDPKAKELFEGMETPASPDEMVAAYAQVAEKLGYNITAENIREAAKQEEARMKLKTDKVVSDMEALEDDDLEGVAGGFYHYIPGNASECRSIGFKKIHDHCSNDFEDTNCLCGDACDHYFVFYYDCSGEYFASGEEYGCFINQLL